MVIWLLLSCRPDVVEPPAGPASMPAVEVLSRASLDLRGRRPSEAEILLVEADPDALEGLLDGFVHDPGFPERLVSQYSEILRTRADRYLTNFDSGADFLDPAYNLAFRHAVGEEPLRLIAWVAEEDLPWTEVATADYTLANDLLLEHLPLVPIDAEGEGWRPARYYDDRPAAGILSTTGMWWRYTSTFENANRGRAQVIARAFLCDERFESAVSFQGETASLEDRIQADPTCMGCHATLDPLGSYLWGFVWRNQEAWLEATRYFATAEQRWQTETGVAPGFYGEPGDDLQGLGVQIADDPRFVSCAVETGLRTLLDRPMTAEDAPWLSTHREAFLAEGLTLRALYRSLVDDPRYRAGSVKMMRPDQLAGSLEALTGYRWTLDGNDLLDTDEAGVRILAGGVDGVLATQATADPSTTTVLVQERVATSAAWWAVQQEGALPREDRVLFREIDLAEVPSDEEIAAQVQGLLLRAHGRRYDADGDDVVSLVALWHTLHDGAGEPGQAWALVLSAIFRHPDFVLY